MKPDWKDAPEWADWLAMDSDGKWWWYECEPDLFKDCFFLSPDNGRSDFVIGHSWKETIEQRPEPS